MKISRLQPPSQLLNPVKLTSTFFRDIFLSASKSYNKRKDEWAKPTFFPLPRTVVSILLSTQKWRSGETQLLIAPYHPIFHQRRGIPASPMGPHTIPGILVGLVIARVPAGQEALFSI